MTLQFRSLATLPEVPGLVPTTHIGFLTSVTPVQGNQWFLLASMGTVIIHMRMAAILYLNTQSLVCGTIWEGLDGVALLRMCVTGGRVRFQSLYH